MLITGGEPLLHPELFSILNYLKTKKVNLKIATNAIALNKVSEDVIDLIDGFSISLDSCEPNNYKMIRGVDKFNSIINSIKYLVSKGKEVKTTFLLQKNNYEQIIDYIRLNEFLGVNEISILVPNYFGDFNDSFPQAYENLYLDQAEIKKFEKNYLNKLSEIIDSSKIRFNYSADNVNVLVEYFKQKNAGNSIIIRKNKCPFPYNNLVINEKGFFKLCPFMPMSFIDLFSRNDKVNEYMFQNYLFKKYCQSCLEVPLK